MNEEKQRIERIARGKFTLLSDAVKQQFRAMIDRQEHGEAFWLLRKNGFEYSEAARFIMFVQNFWETN